MLRDQKAMMNLLVELKVLRNALLADDEAAILAHNWQTQENTEVQRAVQLPSALRCSAKRCFEKQRRS